MFASLDFWWSLCKVDLAMLVCVCFALFCWHMWVNAWKVSACVCSFLGLLCVAAEGAVRTTWLTLPCVTLCGLVIYYKWYCILSADSLPTLSIGKAREVVCQLLAPSNPRLPLLAALKVKGTTADSPGKSLISQRIGPIWSSAAHGRAAGEAAVCQEDPLKASAASYSPAFFCKNDTFWQASCCADFMPTGETCVRWCNHDVSTDLEDERETKKPST